MIRVRLGTGRQARLACLCFSLLQRIRNVARLQLTAADDKASFVFCPEYGAEFSRYLSYFSKEEGTLAWLNKSLRPTDVFLDIGANIGLYSIYAAKVRPGIQVYAFEPHKPNFVKLLENISLNDLHRAVLPVAIPLGSELAVTRLRYGDVATGSSNSQLMTGATAATADSCPQYDELVVCTSVDDLIRRGAMPIPSLVKIDVDGLELDIVHGMIECLRSAEGPRSVQVEANKGQKARLISSMAQHGYEVDHSHFTHGGKKLLAMGVSEDEIAHNVVFSRRQGSCDGK